MAARPYVAHETILPDVRRSALKRRSCVVGIYLKCRLSAKRSLLAIGATVAHRAEVVRRQGIEVHRLGPCWRIIALPVRPLCKENFIAQPSQ
jgi:hypothetical protein